jgi:L-Ala-D/L-Glu epimerase
MIRTYQIGKILVPKHVFRISRASRPQVDNVFFLAEQDGIIGFGEASPNSFFHENAADVQMTLAGLADYFTRQTLTQVSDITRIWNEIWTLVAPSRACQCAVDLALWDLWAKLNNLSVVELALNRVAWDIPTSATLGISPKSEWDEKISEVLDFPAIKVKMNEQPDLDLLRAIRSKTSASIRVDANGAWSKLDIGALSQELADLGVEFIEQPLPPAEDYRMSEVLANSCLPILADESCAGPADIEAIQGRFSGFNIKLVKCGGLTPALDMASKGQKLGLKTMVGCMLETSLLISAGAVVAQNTTFADLDGSWLLKDDPFEGLSITKGRIGFGPHLGLGVKLKDTLELPWNP